MHASGSNIVSKRPPSRLADPAGKKRGGEGRLTLRKHLDGPAKRTPGLAVDPVRVRGRDDVRPGLVDLRMDHEAGLVDRGLVPALGDVSFAVDQDQVGGLHGREVLPEGVDPEVVLQHGVWGWMSAVFLNGIYINITAQCMLHRDGARRTPHGDMSRHALPVPHLPEEPKRSGHVLLHPPALLVRVRERRDPAQLERPFTVAASHGLELGVLLGRFVRPLVLPLVVLDCDDGGGALWPSDGFGYCCRRRHGGCWLWCITFT